MGCSVSSNASSEKLVSSQEMKLSPTDTPPTSRSAKPRGLSFAGSQIIKKGSSSSYQHYNFLSPPIRTDAQCELRHVIYRPTGGKKTAKVIFKKRAPIEQLQQLKNEIQILEMLDHPNIPKVFEYFEYGNSLILVLDYSFGNDLVEYIMKSRKFTEKDAALLMEQILSSIKYCHSQNILHRNLRVESFVVETSSSPPSLKIIDFDWAVFSDKSFEKLTHITVN
jgi:serine/threonine protein kinase